MTPKVLYMYTGDAESVLMYTRSFSGVSFGFTVGVMSLIIFTIIAAYIATTVILVRKKNSLEMNLRNQKKKCKQQHAIYEELDYQSIKSPSPTIDTGENAAYSSAASGSTITKMPLH